MMVTEQKKVSDFRHDARNLRLHNERNAKMVTDSIAREGFGRSILAANDGTIIAGNQTLTSAQEAGLEDAIVVHTRGSQVVVVQRDDLDPEDERAVRLAIADNRATDLSAFDTDRVLEMARQIDVSDFWDNDEMDALLAETRMDKPNQPTDGNQVDVPPDFGIFVQCADEKDQGKLLEYLATHGYKCRALIT